MKQKRNKKRWAWKKKHLLKHYVEYDHNLAIELVCPSENTSWEYWKRYVRYNNAPKSFRQELQNGFKAKCKQITIKQFFDHEYAEEYAHMYPLFKHDAGWLYW